MSKQSEILKPVLVLAVIGACVGYRAVQADRPAPNPEVQQFGQGEAAESCHRVTRVVRHLPETEVGVKSAVPLVQMEVTRVAAIAASLERSEYYRTQLELALLELRAVRKSLPAKVRPFTKTTTLRTGGTVEQHTSIAAMERALKGETITTGPGAELLAVADRYIAACEAALSQYKQPQ